MNPGFHFSTDSLLLLLAGLLALLVSLFLHESNRTRVGLALLVLAAGLLGMFVSGLDDFLCLWDEQFHALVARNMIENPLKPMLYRNPVLPYDYRDWTSNAVWLHKQPLFLWQMALSLKVFGMEARAVRLPSVLMHAVAVLMVYRIGLIALNRDAGFYGAAFFAVAYHLLELAAGKFPTDHNDVAFMFYVSASLWAWFEYEYSGRKFHWVVAVGLLSGAAVLVKWLVGLLVYAVWGVVIAMLEYRQWRKIRVFGHGLSAFFITLLVFLPWQLYVFSQYPAEAAHEFALNHAHFWGEVENHGGDAWFHLRALRQIYGGGEAVPFLLLAGLVLFVVKAAQRAYKVAVLSAILIVYVFYSMAATKMTSFGVIVAPLGFLLLGLVAMLVLKLLESGITHQWLLRGMKVLAVFAVCLLLMDVGRIERNHTDKYPHDNMNRAGDLAQMKLVEQLKTELNGGQYVLFNAALRPKGHIVVMFYTDVVAYDFVPDSVQIELARQAGYEVAVVDDGALPQWVLNDVRVKCVAWGAALCSD